MISSLRIRIGRITFNAVNHYKVRAEDKEAKKLKKLIDKMQPKKNSPKRPAKLLEKGILPSAYENEGQSRRVTVLNKVYMEHVTIMLSSGFYGRRLDDLGVEITKVKFASGLNYLNLYYIIRKQDIPEQVINEVLFNALKELQEKMGGIRFTSRVPMLRFVKDLRLERELKLEEIFQSADFGRDFEPTFGKKFITRDFAPKPFEMPVMRQNVLGLDHAKIKGRLLAQIAKFKAINTAPLKDEAEEEEEEEEHKMPHKLIQFSKTEFLKFYKRRRILELKMMKREKQEVVITEDEYVNAYDYEEENEDDKDVEEDVDEEEYEELRGVRRSKEDQSELKT